MLIVATSLQASPQDTHVLHDQLTLIAGDVSEDRFSHSVHSAAKEYIIGRHFSVRDQHGAALAHYRRSAELDNLSFAPWVGIAITESVIGKPSASLSAWREVISRNPTHSDALLLLGLEAARVGNLSKANEYLARSWVLHDVLPIEALLRDAALKSTLEKAGNTEVSEMLGKTYQHVFDIALAELPMNYSDDVWRSVIQQLVDIHTPEIALQLAQEGIKNSRNQLRGFLLTGIPVLEAAANGDGRATIESYKNALIANEIGLGPRWFEPVSLAQAFSLAAQSMSMLGAKESAISLYKESVKINPDDPLVLNNLAWTLMERDGLTEETMELCMRTYELDSSSSYILDTVGWAYLLKGDIEKAVDLLVQALRASDQRSPELYDHLGDAYWLSGEPQNAMRSWQTAATILHAIETRRNAIEGFAAIIYTVWGISVLPPEAMYDLEIGDLYQMIMQKLAIVETGKSPTLDQITNYQGVK